MLVRHLLLDITLCFAAVVCVLGCSRTPTSVTQDDAAASADRTAMSPVFAEAYRRAAHQQSKTIRGTTIVVHRACNDVNPSAPTGAQQRWIGVDVELQTLSEQFEGLDLRDIEVHDGTTGQKLAEVSSIQRLSDNAWPADDADPIFAGVDKYRGLLVYQIPISSRSVTLFFEGAPLNADPLLLAPCDIQLPQPSLSLLGIAKKATDSPLYDAYVLTVECHEWSRMATPGALVLRCLVEGRAQTADVDRFIEIDDDRRPMDSAPGDRPLYPRQRWFVVEFWTPADALVVDVSWDGTPYSLPKENSLDLPPETLEALAAAPRLERARHRRN